MAVLRLQLVTPERSALDVACDEVELPGTEGYFGVLPGHTPLMALLAIGVATYKSGATSHSAAVGAGFAEVSGDVVRVLADFAELPSEIDRAAADRDRISAEEAMKSCDGDALPEIQDRLATANARLTAAGRA
jgi:F-type H+-transporting ATPase subunit epsilon